jgi:hypothetical protein
MLHTGVDAGPKLPEPSTDVTTTTYLMPLVRPSRVSDVWVTSSISPLGTSNCVEISEMPAGPVVLVVAVDVPALSPFEPSSPVELASPVVVVV